MVVRADKEHKELFDSIAQSILTQQPLYVSASLSLKINRIFQLKLSINNFEIKMTWNLKLWKDLTLTHGVNFPFQNPTRHPVNIRDQTLEALGDALYVAPVVETGDYHSSLNAKSWFYVFEYQTKNSFYKQVTSSFSYWIQAWESLFC